MENPNSYNKRSIIRGRRASAVSLSTSVMVQSVDHEKRTSSSSSTLVLISPLKPAFIAIASSPVSLQVLRHTGIGRILCGNKQPTSINQGDPISGFWLSPKSWSPADGSHCSLSSPFSVLKRIADATYRIQDTRSRRRLKWSTLTLYRP